MRTALFSCLLAVSAASPAFSDQGCIEISTTTITATVCTQFGCIQSLNGSCVMWSCSATQSNKYVDTNASGCSRVANCGKNAFFSAGAPAAPDIETTEVCDWYPCVQIDPATHICQSYLCVSRRVSQVVRTAYPNALCASTAPKFQQPPQPQKRITPGPAPTDKMLKPLPRPK